MMPLIRPPQLLTMLNLSSHSPCSCGGRSSHQRGFSSTAAEKPQPVITMPLFAATTCANARASTLAGTSSTVARFQESIVTIAVSRVSPHCFNLQ